MDVEVPGILFLQLHSYKMTDSCTNDVFLFLVYACRITFPLFFLSGALILNRQ